MRNVFQMTIAGRIRSLRIALRKAGHPKVDEYDTTYLHYAAEECGTIEKAVDALFRVERIKRKK